MYVVDWLSWGGLCWKEEKEGKNESDMISRRKSSSSPNRPSISFLLLLVPPPEYTLEKEELTHSDLPEIPLLLSPNQDLHPYERAQRRDLSFAREDWVVFVYELGKEEISPSLTNARNVHSRDFAFGLSGV